jgi:hypothetical protein
MIPSHPFELTIYNHGRVQVRQFENIATALTAAQSLRAGIVNGWQLVIVIETKTLRDHLQN